MTRKELADVLGYESVSLQSAINKAKKLIPSMADKIKRGNLFNTSFSREEIECICRCMNPPLNEIQIALVMERYVEHEGTFLYRRSPYIDGTEEFEERCRKDPHVRACANCSYCTGQSKRGTISYLHPFCLFYNRYIYTIRISVRHKNWQGKVVKKFRAADIFKDRCESWVRGEVRKFERPKNR